MIKKSLLVVSLVLTGVVGGGSSAFASTDYSQLCVAAGSSDAGRIFISTASTSPLAATGAGLDVGGWLFAGMVILIVGLALTLLPSRRLVGATGPLAGPALSR